jgi:hypothetical protein
MLADGTNNWFEAIRDWIEHAREDFPELDMFKFLTGPDPPINELIRFALENLAAVPPEKRVQAQKEVIALQQEQDLARTKMHSTLWSRCDESMKNHVRSRKEAEYKQSEEDRQPGALLSILKTVCLSSSTETPNAIIECENRLHRMSQGILSIYKYKQIIHILTFLKI